MSTTSTDTLAIEGRRVNVGLADFKVSNDPEVLLCSLPLGTCLAVIFYEPIIRVGGLLHSLLPLSGANPARAAKSPATFMDSGLKLMLAKLESMGASRGNLLTYAVGGADLMDDGAIFNMGSRNFETLKNLVDQTGLRLNGTEVGGKVNRSVCIHLGSGEVYIKHTGRNGLQPLCKR